MSGEVLGFQRASTGGPNRCCAAGAAVHCCCCCCLSGAPRRCGWASGTPSTLLLLLARCRCCRRCMTSGPSSGACLTWWRWSWPRWVGWVGFFGGGSGRGAECGGGEGAQGRGVGRGDAEGFGRKRAWIDVGLLPFSCVCSQCPGPHLSCPALFPAPVLCLLPLCLRLTPRSQPCMTPHSCALSCSSWETS